MLYNVQPNGYSCTQDENTFFIHVDIRVTVGFTSSLNEDQSKEFQQSTFDQVCESLNSKSSVTNGPQTSEGTPQRLLPRFQNVENSIANQSNPVAPKTNTQLNTICNDEIATSNAEPPAQKPQDSVINTATCPDDSGLAQSLCSALSRAATRINTMGLPDWWSDIERLRPRGDSLHETDAALCVEDLDENCEKYSTSLVYRASMTWLIRCFLEILRRAFHRRSRANAKKHREDKVNREQRYRVGELMIAITKRLFSRYGKKAYTLYALLAAVEDFDPKAGHWRKFSKARMLRLASRIATTLLTPEYEELWQNVNPALAFDPAEFFSTTSSFSKTSCNLSYSRARQVLGLTHDSGESDGGSTAPGFTTPATPAVAPCSDVEPLVPTTCTQWTSTWSGAVAPVVPCNVRGEAGQNVLPDTDSGWPAMALGDFSTVDTGGWNPLCGEVELSTMPSLNPLWTVEGRGPISAPGDNWSALCGEVEISTLRDAHMSWTAEEPVRSINFPSDGNRQNQGERSNGQAPHW